MLLYCNSQYLLSDHNGTPTLFAGAWTSKYSNPQP